MRMPEIRARLHEIAHTLAFDSPDASNELHDLAEATRRQYFGRAPVKNHVGRGFRRKVLAYAAAHPNAHVQDIATALGVNLGRVAPILNPEVKA